MSLKKIGMYVLVSLLLAVSAQAKIVQQPPRQQLRPQTRISERLAEIAKQPILPREIKDCHPPCPTGYDYVAGRATPPTEGAYQTYQGYWYACKVNDDIKNRASCAQGFDKIWLDQANAYDCVCPDAQDANHPKTCLEQKAESLSTNPVGSIRHAVEIAYTACLGQRCPYSINSACPTNNGFTYKIREGTNFAERYTCILPGYGADDYNLSLQPNAWDRGFCSTACNSLETVTDPSDGTIKCYK